MLMWESEERGVLILNGTPMSTDDIAAALHLDKQIVTDALRLLNLKGTYSVRDDGAIYCRGMVRREGTSTKRSIAGAKGGNPVLLNQKNGNGGNLGNPRSDNENDIDNENDTSVSGEGGPGETQVVVLDEITLDQYRCSVGEKFINRAIEKLSGWILQSKGDPFEYKKRLQIGQSGAVGAFQNWVFKEVAKEFAAAERMRTGPPKKETNFERNIRILGGSAT